MWLGVQQSRCSFFFPLICSIPLFVARLKQAIPIEHRGAGDQSSKLPQVFHLIATAMAHQVQADTPGVCKMKKGMLLRTTRKLQPQYHRPLSLGIR